MTLRVGALFAIRRQEHAFGRPAPLPTEPGAKGQPRLSPRFVEWLMGLPEEWVTDIPGISRNDQLKALGNGVVPQQAAAAFTAFLHDTTQELQHSTQPHQTGDTLCVTS